MNRPHVAVVKSEYSPFGGAEIVARDFINLLLSNGCRVTLVTGRNQPWPIKHPYLRVVETVSIFGNRLWQLWRFSRAARAFLIDYRHRFDAILAIDKVDLFSHYHAGGMCHKTSLSMREKESSPLSAFIRRNSPFHRLAMSIEARGFNQSPLPKIHCCSNLIREDIVTNYPHLATRTKVIPNSIDWHAIGEQFRRRHELAETYRKNLGLEDNHNYLLFIGSGFASKGLDHCITSLPDGYDLLVVGQDNSGTYKKLAMKCGKKKRIHFLGKIENAWRLCAVAKALVLPARYEPFGLAAAEAQAMGLPVLVSDKTGYAEHILVGKTGIIAKVEGQPNIAEAMNILCQHIEAGTFMSSDQIRKKTEHLDHRNIRHRIINEFLGLSI